MAKRLGVNEPDFWNDNYREGRSGWDLGTPTPVFVDLLKSGQFPPGRLIVLGAGRGHDAREFARHGFTVTAVDFAAEAIGDMKRLADPKAPIEILQADIFKLPPMLDGSFDYLLEYTCFCAIDPARRAEYADVVARLLKRGGIYIDLAFPLDNQPGGPPFSVDVPEILRLFGERSFKLLQRGRPSDSVKPRRGREELLIFEKG